MSEFKKGDRVLVPGRVRRDPGPNMDVIECVVEIQDTVGRFNATDPPDLIFKPQPDPGVPVADLLEELELRDAAMEEVLNVYDQNDAEMAWRLHSETYREKEARIKALRQKREAAQRPKYEEGDRVRIDATVCRSLRDGTVRVEFGHSGCRHSVWLRGEDIRKADAQED